MSVKTPKGANRKTTAGKERAKLAVKRTGTRIASARLRKKFQDRSGSASAAVTSSSKLKVGILASDCDGTFEREQFLALFIQTGTQLGIFPPQLGEDFAALRTRHRDRHISFEAYDRTMIEMFLTHVRGLPESDITRIAQRIFERDKDWNYRFTKALLHHLKPTHRSIMITGALDEIVRLLAPYWGFHAHAATVLETDETGRLTGNTKELPVSDKRTALLRFKESVPDSTLADSVAIGDTLSDMPMLDVVERPIAFNPDYALAVPTQENGWTLVVERKDIIYVIPPDCPIFPASRAHEAVKFALHAAKHGWPRRTRGGKRPT